MRESYPESFILIHGWFIVQRRGGLWFLLYQGHQIISASLQMQYFHCRNVCLFEAPKIHCISDVAASSICSDLSALFKPSPVPSSDYLTLSVQSLIHRLLSRRYDLVLSWVPGHVSIRGNELADQAAKSATRKTRIDIPSVPLSDVQAFLKRSVLRAWQTEWHNSTFKLSAIKNSVYPWRSSSRSCRCEEVI